MRVIAAMLLLVCPLAGQFRTTVPLVVVPATVTDEKGRLVDVDEKDLILYDNNVPQTAHVDTVIDPISLVVVVQASTNALAVLDKLGGSGILFSALLAGERGETAILSFSNEVKLVQDFTSDADALKKGLKGLRVRGDAGVILDGLSQALRLLAARGNGRRRVILCIAERRDRGSQTKLAELMADRELQNTSIYWLTYSTLLVPFTNRPKTVWDRMSDEEKNKPSRLGRKTAYPDEEALALDPVAPGSLINLFVELARRASVDAADLLSRVTGGRVFSFLKRSGLEDAVHAVGDEVHRQYILSFQPTPDTAGLFHPIRAVVKGRPDLRVRTREGYWSVQ